MKITVFTRKGEAFEYNNADQYQIHNCGPGLLTIRHDTDKIDYYRLGYVDKWTVE